MTDILFIINIICCIAVILGIGIMIFTVGNVSKYKKLGRVADYLLIYGGMIAVVTGLILMFYAWSGNY